MIPGAVVIASCLATVGWVPEIPFERYALDNGLTVILHEDHAAAKVAVSVWYEAGALHEPPGRSGFAHLFEHLMFQKSAHVGEDQLFAILNRRGATEVNGTTSFDRTVYYETVPSHEIELALWLESDRMGFLLAALDEATLESQKQVVRSERRLRVNDSPYGLIDELIIRHAYPPPHPYHGGVIGTAETIEAATLSEVRRFFATHYAPANATLTLAGDFDSADAKALIAKSFGTLPSGPRPPPVEVRPPGFSRAARIEAREPIARQPRVTMIWLGPPMFAGGTAELDMVAGLLDDEDEAMLRGTLLGRGIAATSVSARFWERRGGSLFRIDVLLDPGADPSPCVDEVDRLLERLRKSEGWKHRLGRIMARHERRVLLNLQRLQGRAHVLQLYQSVLGDPAGLAADLARYRRVTPGGVQAAIRDHLHGHRLVVVARPAEGRIR